MPGRSWRAGKPCGDGKPEDPDRPLEKGINKSSSDDRPGPSICDSKYVEDAKAARSVRVWDRVPIKYNNKSSSDDRPGPGICDSKYVEDAKAARSVRVWDRVPIKYIVYSRKPL